jgi:hypothetical protein
MERSRRLLGWCGPRGGSLLLVGAFLTGCGPEFDLPGEGFTAETDNLVVGPGFYYCQLGADGKGCVTNGMPVGPVPTIPMCWEPGTFGNADFATQRAWNEEAVRKNWARYARVNFINPSGASTWGQCAPGQSGRHSFIDTAVEENGECGGASGFGRDRDGLDFGQRLPSCVVARCGSDPVEQCVKHVGLHEFGHILAFDHENQKPDTPASCRLPSISGELNFGSYNCNINYGSAVGVTCSAMFSVSGCADPAPAAMDITPGDIAGLQRVYGRRLPGLVDTQGRCITAPAGGVLGSQVYDYDCEKAANGGSLASYSPVSKNIKITVGPPKTAGTVTWAIGSTSSSSGSFIKNTDGTGAGSRWNLSSVLIRGWGGLCLDLHNGDTSGGTVQLYYCHNGSHQKWTLTAAGEIRYRDGSTSKCLTMPSSGSGPVTVTSCATSGSTAQRQRFSFGSFQGSGRADTLHQIISNAFPKCLDAQAPWDADYVTGHGIPLNGQSVQAFDCTADQFNQKFNFTGPIVNDYGLCLDRRNGRNNTVPTQAACNGSESQVFDLYF